MFKRILKNYSIKQILPIILLFIIGASLTALAAQRLYKKSEIQLKNRFQQITSLNAYSIESQLRRYLSPALLLASLFDASQQVSYKEFIEFSGDLIRYWPGIQLLEWIPRVPHRALKDFIKTARTNFPNFQLSMYVNHKKTTSIQKKSDYYPIYYIHPLNKHKVLLGFDISSNAARLKAMRIASETNQPIITGSLYSIEHESRKDSLIAFFPTYQKNKPIKTITERLKYLNGFTACIYRIKNIIQQAIPEKNQDIDIMIFHLKDKSTKKILYTTNKNLAKKIKQRSIKNDSLHMHYYFKLGNQSWLICFSPKAGYYKIPKNTLLNIILILFLGTFITLLLCKIAWSFIQKKSLLEHDKIDLKDQIDKLLKYDTLTLLPNRQTLLNSIEERIKEYEFNNHPLSVIYIDIDQFDKINQMLGFLSGDHILKKIALRLQECISAEELVGHLAGDKFIIIVNQNQTDSIIELANKIATAINKTFILDDITYRLTCSIGIAIYPKSGNDAFELLKNAQIAMQQVKNQGGNNFQFYNKTINTEAKKYLTIDAKLQNALEKNEFFLYYQPQASLKTGKLIGIEALIRWKDHELGFISPNDFIPVAEKNGAIIAITSWVLKQACIQNMIWQEQKLITAPISVNIPASYFFRTTFYEAVANILKFTKMPPQYLELELTERVLMKHEEKIVRLLHKLNDDKIKLSIDDFGTGYSNLGYLSRYSIDKLKIDIEFIKNLTVDPHSDVIVKTIINLAHNLNMHVIAEGVETKEQLQFLKGAGCDSIQGYYYAKPLSPEEFEAFIKKNPQLIF